jgi:hypothetical protein
MWHGDGSPSRRRAGTPARHGDGGPGRWRGDVAASNGWLREDGDAEDGDAARWNRGS